MVKKLRKKHRVICTSRQYREIIQLAKIRKMDLIFVGKHGGKEKHSKLISSIDRINKLTRKIKKDAPDLTISFCSPEASRISFGLGIKHIAFCDAPHAEAVMRLTVPLVDRLLTPWIIPKKEFTKYGISKNKIFHYKAIDAGVIIKGENMNFKLLTEKNFKKKILLIRPYESQAAYAKNKKSQTVNLIRQISKVYSDYNVTILGRYSQQTKLKNEFGKKISIVDHAVESSEILSRTNIFIGSGGTMTAEAALRGIPTISYNAVPNLIENYLVKKGLIIRQEDPKKIVKLIQRLLDSDNNKFKKKAKVELNKMVDPYLKLQKIIQTITE